MEALPYSAARYPGSHTSSRGGTSRTSPIWTDRRRPASARYWPASPRALRAAAAAEKTYVYIFGDRVPHFHVNLAPHRAGDALRGGPGLVDPGAPDAALTAHQAVAAAARAALARQ